MLQIGQELFKKRKFLSPTISAENYFIPAKTLRLDQVASNYYISSPGDESGGIVVNL